MKFNEVLIIRGTGTERDRSGTELLGRSPASPQTTTEMIPKAPQLSNAPELPRRTRDNFRAAAESD